MSSSRLSVHCPVDLRLRAGEVRYRMQAVNILSNHRDRALQLAAELEPAFDTRVAIPEPLSIVNALSEHNIALIDIEWIARSQAWLNCNQMRWVIALAPGSDSERYADALDCGVADCVSVSISGTELTARIQGLIKRQAGSAPGRVHHQAVGAWSWDERQIRLRCPAGQSVKISGYGMKLLLELLNRPDRILSRSFLATSLSHGGRLMTGRNIDVVVSRLRRTLACHDPLAWHVVATNRDEGYSLNASVFQVADGVTGFRLR